MAASNRILGTVLGIMAAFSAPEGSASALQETPGKIKRAGAAEAQARREAYREEGKRQGQESAVKAASKEELYQYYSSKLYQAVRLAKEPPGNDLERHWEATAKIAAELPTVHSLLAANKALADDHTYQDLKEVEDNAAAWRKQAAAKLAANVDTMMEWPRKSKGADVVFGKQVAEARRLLDAAARYDANHPQVAKLLAELSSMEKGAAGAVAARKWEGHRNAPQGVGELAAAAMKYFKGPKGWTDRYTVLAVAIRGPWTVQKKNLLGAPILYGIPAQLAVQKEEDRKLKQVRVFEGTLITAERAGVQAKPPFEGFYVGQNWLVNADSVK
ncbi:MAG: hypothetical protein HY823_00550 [Acidobacteria bacterium]|nr:hypothetical protein [Acidobacteriota bacterium]